MENRKNNARRDGGKGLRKSDNLKRSNNKGGNDHKFAERKEKKYAKPSSKKEWKNDMENVYTDWFDIEADENKSYANTSGYNVERKEYKKSRHSFERKDNKYDFGNNKQNNYYDRDSNDRFDRKSHRAKNNRYDNKRKNTYYYDDITDDDINYFENSAKRQNYKNATKSLENKKKSDDGIRLNKYIANAGICSRREADVLIASGVVSVNGEVVTQMGYKVKPNDVVNYGGERLVSEKKRYLLLNKPKGYITTSDDPQERKTVMMLVENACKERIYPVGRLDRNTTGVLLFTNDGDMAKRLTHPSTGARKIYHVELDKNLTHADMQRMKDGIMLEDGQIAVDDVQYVGNGEKRNIVGVVLHSGKNRIVRRIFEAMGYEVCKLDRVLFAELTKKDLPRGRWRMLTDKEVSYLKMI